MNLDSLDKLYVHEMKDLHSAESQLIEALPKMAQAATDAGLKEAFEAHLDETKTHLARIESIFEKLDYSPAGHRCVAMEGLIKEAEGMLSSDAPAAVRDAALIGAAQRVEHYEIAGYGTACAFAEKLGRYEDADLLQETLDEEGSADRKLSRLATRAVNFKAITV